MGDFRGGGGTDEWCEQVCPPVLGREGGWGTSWDLRCDLIQAGRSGLPSERICAPRP